MKSLYQTVFLLSVILLFNSCNDCTNFEEINAFTLSNISKDFFQFVEQDSLVYIDQDGEEIIFHIDHSLRSFSDTIHIRKEIQDAECKTLIKYYNIEASNLSLNRDQNPRMSLGLSMDIINHNDLDSIIVFEKLSILFRDVINNKLEDFQFEILTNEIQNNLSSFQKFQLFNQTNFIGDTTVFNILYPNAYNFINENGSMIYFNQTSGPFYFDFQNGSYWRLEP